MSKTTIPPAQTTPTRPTILCLHGGGSNDQVFKIQCRRLIWNLTEFRFIFAQAPILGDPGFGMLPVFESCAPFYRWVSRKFSLEESHVEITPKDEVEDIDQVLRKALQDEHVQPSDIVGVIGFSQGARLVAGLLLRQLMKQPDETLDFAFKFGVVVGGPYPPIALHEVEKTNYEKLRQIPTVHAWGKNDHIKAGCEQLWKQCEGETCFQMEFEGGHHMPLTDQEARDLCDLIRGAWYAAGGKFSVNEDESY